MLAQEQVENFARDLNAMAQRAAEIAEGGEAYPVGCARSRLAAWPTTCRKRLNC